MLIAPLQLAQPSLAQLTTVEVPHERTYSPHHRSVENGHQLAEQNVPPIVAAVDSSAASRPAINEAVRLAAELDAPIVFVYVRRGPAGFYGRPVYQQRLTKEMARARRVLDRALAVAHNAGVHAEGEILEGSPRRRIPEFARDRGARVVVIGVRRHKVGPSVSRAVVSAADRPVVVANGLQRVAVAGEPV